jgi:hypothetical protein
MPLKTGGHSQKPIRPLLNTLLCPFVHEPLHYARRDSEDPAEDLESLLFGPDFPPSLIGDKPVGVTEHVVVNAVIFIGIAILAGVLEPLLEARQIVVICFGDHRIT